MLKKWFKQTWMALTLAITPAIAYAGSAEDAAQGWFNAQTQTERAVQLSALASMSATDNTAQFGLGSVQFFSAIEGLSADLVRYGAMNQRGGPGDFIPFPLPANPKPEKLSYQKLRDVFTRFETNLETARATLASVDPGTPASIEISFAQARFNLAGSENITDEMRFAGIIQAMSRPTGQSDATPAAPTFRFDNADAIWLEGYSNVLLAQVDFLLAHDFERAFNTSFQMFFPRSNLPLQNDLVPDGYQYGGFITGNDAIFADLISLIHLMDWKVVEPERRADFTRHMREVARLSHANWDSILAETDNDHEWLPGPQQPGKHPLTGIEVTQEMVDGWDQSMILLNDLMSGKRLIPHWRFEGRGINLKRYFESSENFDPVLLLTGPAAIPFLEEGNILTVKEWRDIQNTVGRRNFGMIAIWFN